MPSTAKHGEVSRIVPVFEPGTTVTTTRTDVHYIVTEYGVLRAPYEKAFRNLPGKRV